MLTPWLTKLPFHDEEEIVCLQDSQKITLDREVNSNRREILELLSSCPLDLSRFDKKMQQLWAKLVSWQEENPMDFSYMNLMTCDIVSLAVRCILYVLSSNKKKWFVRKPHRSEAASFLVLEEMIHIFLKEPA